MTTSNQNHLGINARVLVLDDEQPIRRLVKTALRTDGCTVETAKNGREGLEILLRDDFDVLVVDLRMREMDGITFLQEALKIWPWLGVVIMTGFADEKSIAEVNALGVRRILSKPIEVADLRKNVSEEAQSKKERVELPAHLTLDKVKYQLGILRQLSETAIAAESMTEALRGLIGGLSDLLPSAVVGVLGLDEGEEVMLLSIREPISSSFLEQVEKEIRTRYEALGGRSLRSESLRVEIDGSTDDKNGADHISSTFTVPVMSGGELHGLLTLATTKNDAYTTTDISFLYHAASHLSTVFAALSHMRRLAIHDPITGLYNRRHLEEVLERTWEVSSRYDHPMAVVMIDLDHFKTLNDTFGHLIGDQALSELSELLRKVVRASDIIARYGGDEMVVVLPQAERAEARAFCERLIHAVRKKLFCANTQPLHLTVSIGVTDSQNSGRPRNASDILDQADQALYSAKKAGRDTYRIWSDVVRKDATPQIQSAFKEAQLGLTQAEYAGEKGRIMIVDDEPSVCMILKQILIKESYKITTASSVDKAVKTLTEHQGEFDLVITDLNMPEKGGIDLLRELDSADKSIIKLVMTGDVTTDNAIASLRHGAYDFIAKPFAHDRLVAVVERAFEYRRLIIENKRYQLYLEDMVSEKSAALSDALEQVKDSFNFTLEAFVALLDVRERATGQHSLRVRELALVLGRNMGLTGQELEEIGHGALLHDIGKIGIPDHVLLKPDSLTDEEWNVMKRHPEIGYNILQSSPGLGRAAEIVLSHQEKFDGTGYPRGLKGSEICLGARIFCIADAYDAMRSDRVYRKALSCETALEEIRKCSGTHFDPDIVDIFVQCQPEMEATGNWENQKKTEPINPCETMLSTAPQ